MRAKVDVVCDCAIEQEGKEGGEGCEEGCVVHCGVVQGFMAEGGGEGW